MPLLSMRRLAVAAAALAAAASAASALTLRDIPIATSTSPQYLDGSSWVATEPTLGLTIPATVPGDVITDLQRAGVIGDPYYELNFLDNRTLWSNDREWTYSTNATLPPPGTPAGASLVLVFDGIKMGARVSLNSVLLGTVTNQFVRSVFPLPPSALAPAGQPNLVTVAFDPTLSLAGRYMAATGGWDWAPLSQLSLNDTVFGVMSTFSSGIWKSVYVAALAPAGSNDVAITAVVPLTHYLGAYPVGALVDGAHAGFTVNVTTHLLVPEGGAQGTVTVSGTWSGCVPVSSPLTTFPAGDASVTLTLAAPAASMLLWWPNGLGGQPLYNISAAWAPASAAAAASAAATTVTSVRRLGFRVPALVTVNDTNATVVQESTGADGSGTFGMFFRINGAAIYARGGNLVPMEELEGRLDAGAYATLVRSTADANFNIMRVWGGGIYPPDVFYDTCDEVGIILYHDLQFARGNFPQPLPDAANASIVAEVTHQVRRLSHHPSVVLYDSNNEDVVEPTGPTSVYSTLILTAVAAEDNSRILWPNSPSAGWRTGVDRLYGTPNGLPLVSLGGGHDYFAGNEWHRFYQAGVGAYDWQTVVRDPWSQAHTFPANMPMNYLAQGPTGPGQPSYFVSEFGSASMSSFESMSGTLAPSSWGLHGGDAPNNCTSSGGTFYMNCTGRNSLAQRNWACDNLVWSYFGPALLNASGEIGFKGALFQCQLAALLNMQTVVEGHRGQNNMGVIEWQLNEM
jgi:beta-mannosidase